MKINAFSYAQLIKCITEGPCTIQDACDYTGLHYMTCQQYLRELYRAKVIHISAWEKDPRGRDVIKVYKFGKGRDAQRQKLTGAERMARMRERQKAMRHAQVIAGTARYVQAANGRVRFERITQ